MKVRATGQILQVLLLSLTATAAQADQIVVILSTDSAAPSPKEIVNAVNEAGVVPSPFDTGSPTRANYVIADRASALFSNWLDSNPGSDRAKLERGIVLSYSSAGDKTSAMSVLSTDPSVEWVGDNDLGGELSSPPNDPYLAQQADPEDFQWGPHHLGLLDAWELARGHSYVGIADIGLEATTQDQCLGLSPREGGSPDLRSYSWEGSQYVYQGGSFRAGLSKDVGNVDGDAVPDYCVDEKESEAFVPGGATHTASFLGHGTHVSGIAAASTNNGLGVAGSQWTSSLIFAKPFHLVPAGEGQVSWGHFPSNTAEAINWLVERGAQLISMSWNKPYQAGSASDLAVSTAFDRDVLLFAAAHNGGSSQNPWCLNSEAPAIPWPANDTRVLAIGAVDPDGDWACYSRYDSTLDLVGPGTDVLSTFYSNGTWNAGIADCYDDNFTADGLGGGYGRCSGTSMSTPAVAGLGSLLRGINPLLSRASVTDILTFNTADCGGFPGRCGHGIPVGGDAAAAALGSSAEQLLSNRIIPMFALRSSTNSTHLFTTVPQMAAAAIFSNAAYTTRFPESGPTLLHYAAFPGNAGTTPPCGSAACRTPRSPFSVFSSSINPIVGAPSLAPLYRLSAPVGSDPIMRRQRYTTSVADLTTRRNQGWLLDGIEGFVHPACTPGSCSTTCRPPGAELLMSVFKAATSDYALALESQVSSWQTIGYALESACLGFAYPSTDSDTDGVVDGFEELAGTHANVSDSDCDLVTDGSELSSYSTTAHSYSDPLGSTTCWNLVLANEVDGGTHSPWETDPVPPVNVDFCGYAYPVGILGQYSTMVTVDSPHSPSPPPSCYSRDIYSGPNNRHRMRFYFSAEQLSMSEGSSHVIFLAKSQSGATVLQLDLRRFSGVFQVRLNSFPSAGSPQVGGWRSISGADPVVVETDWKRASTGTASNGFAKLYLDGRLVDLIAQTNNFALNVHSVELGLVSGWDSGTWGSQLFDAYQATTGTYIGVDAPYN